MRGVVEEAQPDDEADEGDDVEDPDEVRVLEEAREVQVDDLFLNISSMRSVTRKPPTMLIVPKAIAITSRNIEEAGGLADQQQAAEQHDPWIALVADIRGVCSVFGTFEDHLEADEGGEHEDGELSQ